MDIIYSHQSLKDLKKLDKQIQKRIVQKLEFYVSQSDPLQSADKITDPSFGEWRFRIGDYRILFDVKEKRIIILKIGHRREIYK